MRKRSWGDLVWWLILSPRLVYEIWTRFRAGENRIIQLPPGIQLHRIAEFLFSPKTYHEVFETTLRDLFDEYCEALKVGQLWKAHWVRVRGYWSFWSAVIAQLPISAIETIYKIWKIGR